MSTQEKHIASVIFNRMNELLRDDSYSLGEFKGLNGVMKAVFCSEGTVIEYMPKLVFDSF